MIFEKFYQFELFPFKDSVDTISEKYKGVELFNSMSISDFDNIYSFVHSRIGFYDDAIHDDKDFVRVGEGSFGEVFRFKGYAIKIALDKYCDGGDGIRNDAYVLSKLQGLPCIPKIYANIKDEAMISEFVDGCDVGYVTNDDVEKVMRKDFQEILSHSIVEIYRKGFNTYDLHENNVMLDRRTGLPVIVDVGLFERLSKTEQERVDEDPSYVLETHVYQNAMSDVTRSIKNAKVKEEMMNKYENVR